MSNLIIRIDDRLIHGQIVVGWCPRIKPDRIILCNDEVAQSEVERQIYQDAAADYKISICAVESTVDLLKSNKIRDEKILLIISTPKDAVRLFNSGIKMNKLMVGGMHFHPGKRRISDFIYIDDTDNNYLQLLHQQNVQLEGKDVPTCKSIDIAGLLGFSTT